MTTSTPRRPKCSASLCSGSLRRPGRSRLQPIEHVQHGVHVLGRRRHVLDDLAVEGAEADPVALVVDQVGQAGGDDARVVELGDAAAAVVHRLRHVEQHREVHVGLGFVFLDVVAVGPRPQPPVHPPDVVAGHVAAMLGEIDRGAEVRRLVQAVDEAVGDHARHELQVPDAREHRGIHEARAGDDVRLSRRHHIPERGSGTTSSSRSTI